MSDGKKLCMSCMNPVPADATECPACGFNGSQQNSKLYLPIGHRITNRYVIGKQMDSDADTAVYFGYDITEKKRVEIREFLPDGNCVRNENHTLSPNPGSELYYKTSLMDFCDLYQNLAKITDINSLIKTLDFVEENNTAYAILEVFDGITLRKFLGYNGGMIKWDQCIMLFEPMFDAVNAVHAVKLIHRGVSPDTVFINRSGEIKLGGFATTSVRTKGSEVAESLFSGYSAPEQYSGSMWQGTATDVYSLAATMYCCMTGIDPVDAHQREQFDSLAPIEETLPGIPSNVANAINYALVLNPKERLQTVMSFRKVLIGDVQPEEVLANRDHVPVSEAVAEQEPSADPEYAKKQNLWRILSIVSISFLVVMFVVFFIYRGLNTKLAEEEQQEQGKVTGVSEALLIPDYIGKNVSSVVLDSIDYNFSIQTTYVDGAADGEIVRQAPTPNATAKKGDSITLYVQRIKVIKMIDLEGLSRQNAELRLKELGVPSSSIEFKTQETSSEPPKLVFEQSIEEDEDFDVNTQKIVLTIAIEKVS